MAENVVKAKKPKKKQARKSLAGWFKQLKAEFKKIIWTDKKTLVKQTIAVLVISAVICVLITLVDSGALALIELII